jgi:type IV secretion system protein VirD4
MTPGTHASRHNTAAGVMVRIGLLLAYLILVNVAATQAVAHYYGYHKTLGPPLSGHLYAPWDWFIWQHRYYSSAKNLYNPLYGAYLLALALGVGGYVLGSGIRNRSSTRYEDIHGTAHWATPQEIRATGLLPTDAARGAGVYVGGWTDPSGRLHYLRHSGPEHIGVIAPTRSGKGVGLVVPTLLSYPHSVVAYDMKAELWNLTAGWRSSQAGNEVLKLASPHFCCQD